MRICVVKQSALKIHDMDNDTNIEDRHSLTGHRCHSNVDVDPRVWG